ncbi:MAG: hypothetical protein ACO3FI_06820 [Cyclobacteriaceae bacterium]
MKRSFKKGELVRNTDGKIMEVLNYIREKQVEVKWYDLNSREVYRHVLPERQLTRA